jgi:hypothetical protein
MVRCIVLNHAREGRYTHIVTNGRVRLQVKIPGTSKINYASGTHIVRAPVGAHTFAAALADHSHTDKPPPQTKNEMYTVLSVSPHGAGRYVSLHHTVHPIFDAVRLLKLLER